MAHLQYFPSVAMALQQEIQKHPKLIAQLQSLPPSAPMEEKFGLIAAYCNMLLDGHYGEEDLEKLFSIMLTKLRDKGKLIVH